MNSRGTTALLLIILTFLAILIIPYLFVKVIPEASFLAKIFMVFTIYATVRGYLGGGMLTLIISAILIYLIVIKYGDASFAVWVFSVVLGLGVSQLVIFSIGHFFGQR